MKTRFIFNPYSGRNRRRPGLAQSIRDFISARSLDAELAMTEGPKHATELAREGLLAGCELVVAVGGDGTMNEVAQGLLHSPAALALVPCGSGNGLAWHLGLPRAPFDALNLIAGADVRGRVAALDTGSANGHPFFNVMGLGLDADVSQRFNTLTHRGLPGYIRTGLAALRDIRHERVTITTGTQSECVEILLLSVANSDQYGNNARIAPGARVDDGALDLIAVQPVGLAAAARLTARLFLGNFDRSPHVRRFRGSHFRIERCAPGVIHTDAETHEAGPVVEVAVHPRSLRVLIPATSRAVVRTTLPAGAGLALQTP